MELLENTLRAIETVQNYLDEHMNCSSLYCVDKEGDFFKTDVGYLFEGLEEMEDYLERKIEKYGNRSDNDNNK